MTLRFSPNRLAASGLATASFLVLAIPSAQAADVYNNLGSSQDGADPVQSYGPLANSFNSGAQGGWLTSVAALLKSGSDQLVGDVQVKLLSDNGMTPGAVLASLGSVSSASVSTSAFASYSVTPVTAFNLAANTRYWVELVAAAPVDIEWSWSTDQTALGVSGQASYSQELGVLPNSAGGPYQMAVAVTAVPEPESLALALAGVALMGGAVWRNKRV